MPIVMREYDECMAPAVIAFNERLGQRGVPWRFQTPAPPGGLPRRPGRTMFQQFFRALDESPAVRGVYCVKHQDYRTGDTVRSIGQLALPLSEGVVDRTYAQVGAQLLMHLMRLQPLC